MIKDKTLFSFILLICQLSSAQVSTKITGPLGIYDVVSGYCYSDSTAIDSTLIQSEYRFGVPCIGNQGTYMGFSFNAAVDSCVQWNCNRVFGIIQPPTEDGVNNQLADTSLYSPYLHADGPGMIQGGQRFSRLSQLYGGFSGVIMDDWNGDTSITRQVRDAVLGKPVDANGNINSAAGVTTPYNKLIAVIYTTNAVPDAMPVIDGVVYSLFQTQNCCYTSIDSDINVLRANFANKEITIAIFLQNSFLGWADPVSIQYMLAHTLDRYDDGDINGVTLFAGIFLLKDKLPLSLSDSLALPHWLDSLYFPYLGQGQGSVSDCNGFALQGASVHVFCKGRVSGDTLIRSYQMTDTNGNYQFGLWAGNRNTDSSFYWLIADAPGYITDTIGFWIKRNEVTAIPNVSLCPGINGTTNTIKTYPNPTNGNLTVEVEADALPLGQLDIYDLLGRKIYTQAIDNALFQVDLSGLSDGMYLVSVSQGWAQVRIGQQPIIVRH